MHLAGVTKAYGDRVLFDDVSLRVSEGQRLCLVGRNGVGKTTLLRVIAGEIAPDGGEVGIPRGWRVALHDQRPPRADGRTLGAYVGELLGDVHAIEQRLADLEAAMAGGDHSDATMHAYAAAQAAFERALALNRDVAAAHANLGLLWFQRRQFARALPYLTRAVELQPNSASAESDLGAVLAALGRTAEAEQHLRRALALDPNDAAARQNLARLRK